MEHIAPSSVWKHIERRPPGVCEVVNHLADPDQARSRTGHAMVPVPRCLCARLGIE